MQAFGVIVELAKQYESSAELAEARAVSAWALVHGLAALCADGGFRHVYYSAADHSELKRTLYTANFVFVFKNNVPNELIPVNPLGLAITYFREDEAFK